MGVFPPGRASARCSSIFFLISPLSSLFIFFYIFPAAMSIPFFQSCDPLGGGCSDPGGGSGEANASLFGSFTCTIFFFAFDVIGMTVCGYIRHEDPYYLRRIPPIMLPRFGLMLVYGGVMCYTAMCQSMLLLREGEKERKEETRRCVRLADGAWRQLCDPARLRPDDRRVGYCEEKNLWRGRRRPGELRDGAGGSNKDGTNGRAATEEVNVTNSVDVFEIPFLSTPVEAN